MRPRARVVWRWEGPGVPILLGVVLSLGLSLGLWGALTWVVWWVLR